MNVIDRIRSVSDEFERETGRRPVSVYLGWSEWAMKEYVGSRDFREPTVDGKRLYVVTEQLHLAVA